MTNARYLGFASLGFTTQARNANFFHGRVALLNRAHLAQSLTKPRHELGKTRSFSPDLNRIIAQN